MVVIIKKIDLFSVLVIENTLTDVETIEHFVIVVENFLQ